MLVAALLVLTAPPPDFSRVQLPKGCAQIVAVTSDSWRANHGQLQTFELKEGKWTAAGLDIPVALGSTGMGWGRGAVTLPRRPGPHKVEGDRRAPAGIFYFSVAFGVDPKPDGVKFTYKQTDDRDYFIDDVASKDYNTWQRILEGDNDPKAKWNSFEPMRVEDHKYDLGLVVSHNMDPIFAGQGSAIFIHCWADLSDTTTGCTSMPKDGVLALLKWLDPAKTPVLVQMPMAELIHLAGG